MSIRYFYHQVTTEKLAGASLLIISLQQVLVELVLFIVYIRQVLDNQHNKIHVPKRLNY